MKKLLLVFTAILFVPLLLLAQTKEELYESEWKKADSLFDRGLPKSALKIAEAVYGKAKAKNQQVQMMKAQMYILRASYQTSEESSSEAIAKAEQEIRSSTFPNNAIWQSITAQLYWNYYQQNRWKMLDRTAVASTTTINDFEQWDATRFYDKVSSLYKASIARSKDLKNINISQYDPILIKGVNSLQFRPTLFDLLAFRAVDFFEQEETGLTKPAYAFVMDDPAAFAEAERFMNHKFESKDSLSNHYLALKVYQEIIASHINDVKPDALIDADLQRLAFAYRHSVLPDKKELYKKALEKIKNVFAANPLSALAAYRLVELMLEDTNTPAPIPYKQGYNTYTPAPQKNYLEAQKKLEEILRKYPDSEGGIYARNLLNSIMQQTMNILTEEAVLPNEPSKIFIAYKNVPKVWLRVVPMTIDDIKNGERYSDKWMQALLSKNAVKTWSVMLPAVEDYNEHTIEIMVDALPEGMYAVIVSGREQFTKEQNVMSYALFQVSRLSVLTQMNGSGYVLDRKTGAPIPDATVELFYERYNNRSQAATAERAASVISARDGSFTLPANQGRGYNALSVKKGKDALFLNAYLNIYRNNNINREAQKRTFLFTDRAIYRPGQSIYYKGIILRTEDGGRKNEVLPNEQTEVTFYDVNGQKISSQTFTTNEFGSFSGSFVAPEGVLTGNMRIGNETGSVDFSVEEYKRPKFYVQFDTLKKEYGLNETVTLQGKALAYAGNNIDGAAVNYRVVRQARWPYFWLYSFYGWGFPPASPEMEISRGTAVTDNEGTFTVSFTTIPDRSIDERTLPIFTYTVYADVTDINGETRSGSQSVNAGYRSVQIEMAMPEKAKPADIDTINISTKNLNGQFVATAVKLRIQKLMAPDKVYRKRMWPMPDQFVIDPYTFKKNFPDDEYKNEADPMFWTVGASVFDKSFTTTQNGQLAIPISTWKENGWYLVEAEAKDKNGQIVTEKKYVQVWDRNNSGKVAAALLVVPQQQTVEPGAKATVFATSGYDKAILIEQAQFVDNKEQINQRDYNGKPLVWEHTVTEPDRGGMMVQYIMVKENRIYTEQATINVPWTNKDLDISWETHRDKLQPGEKETWTMVVRGNKKEKVAAEMVATLYDASLDAFRPHKWSIYELFPGLVQTSSWINFLGFGISNGNQIVSFSQDYRSYEKSYDRLVFPEFGDIYRYDGAAVKFTPPGRGAVMSAPMAERAMAKSQAMEDVTANAVTAPSPQAEEPAQKAATTFPIRTNLNETAFFYPQLKTDADGNIRIQFTLPEALTEWKLMAFAHTKDMSTGLLEGSIKTQKDLMVMPGLPRFLRQGDDITISTKISNLSNRDLSGTASLLILDALTLRPLKLQFRLQSADVSFNVAKGQSSNATWQVHVPEAQYNPVIVRIAAHSGNFTDGEENMLPVLTNRMLVTETMPIWMNGNGTKSFSFDKLKQSGSSNTISQYNLAVEYTSNPAWYAVQALPYLMEYPYECAEQTFNRYYATALAAHIVDEAPRIKEIFKTWQTMDSTALYSSLKKNQELKAALLEETPWVLEAQSETEQKKRIALLFEAAKLAATLDQSAQKLEDMLLPEGAFPWFRGMQPDRHITQYIATGLARLQHLGIKDGKGYTQRILDRALPYLDKKIKEDYELIIKNKGRLDQQHISYIQVQYLYMRSFFKPQVSNDIKKAYDFYTLQAAKYWPSFNPYMKGMISLALNRTGNQQAARDIISSLRETAIRKEEVGMYWMQRGNSYWWYEAPIEAQSLLIEAFTEVAKSTEEVDAMRIWLLKQKQTQSWPTTKATADACYALLLNGTQWLTAEPVVSIKLGDKTIDGKEQQPEKGTGYFKVNYTGADVKPEMGNVQLTVQENTNSASWGAIYWQYFEDMDKITPAATPLVVKKQLFIQRNTDRGLVLEPVLDKQAIKVGDKVISRIEIMVDRDMEYVHLKDMRASCFEPVNVLSAYKWQGGLGYYESTRDASTNFFFGYLRKGKYVFEYPVFVTNKGDFSNGIATIQCMYAPEFSSHSEGIRVNVQ